MAMKKKAKGGKKSMPREGSRKDMMMEMPLRPMKGSKPHPKGC